MYCNTRLYVTTQPYNWCGRKFPETPFENISMYDMMLHVDYYVIKLIRYCVIFKDENILLQIVHDQHSKINHVPIYKIYEPNFKLPNI